MATPEKRAPALIAAQHVVHQVAELVEQGHDVAVLDQALREVADQRALGQLAAGDSADQVELRRVLELSVARVQVEIDPPDQRPVGEDVVGLHVRVPYRASSIST